MDYLWTPWRYQYVSTADKTERAGVPAALAAWPGNHHCVFCNMLASVEYALANGFTREDAEKAARIVVRGKSCYLCLNAYPYNSGHVMVIPYRHQASLAALSTEEVNEMMALAQRTERVLGELYHPQGMNFGLNLGRAAGAGVAEHLHLHALPRWAGDSNFMTVLGETRVLPEALEITWQRMRAAFAE
jgi:ATP adenylyltransferase